MSRVLRGACFNSAVLTDRSKDKRPKDKRRCGMEYTINDHYFVDISVFSD